MTLIVAKLALAPTFVALASIATQRWGPRRGGWLGALPFVGGAILCFYGLEHGSAFAARAAASTIVGVVGMTAFIVAYAAVAPRIAWSWSLPIAWLGFVCVVALLGRARFSPWTAAALSLAALGLAGCVRVEGTASARLAVGPWWDLPARMTATGLMVLTLTGAADVLGPRASGLLAPFPVVGSVVAASTHARYGGRVAVTFLRGMLLGLVTFTLYCLTIALAVPPLGVALGFIAAAGVAVATHVVIFYAAGLHRGTAPQEAPS